MLDPFEAIEEAFAAPVAPAPPIAVAHDLASHEVTFEFGTIKFYTTDGRFQASCPCPGHEVGDFACRFTRYRRAGKSPAKGRPLGLMVAWLRLGRLFTCHDEHIHPLALSSISRGERITARDLLKTVPGGDVLLSKERQRRPGEPEEPMGEP